MSPKVADMTVDDLKDALRDMVRETVREAVEEALAEHEELEDAFDRRLMDDVASDERIPWGEVKASLHKQRNS